MYVHKLKRQNLKKKKLQNITAVIIFFILFLLFNERLFSESLESDKFDFDDSSFNTSNISLNNDDEDAIITINKKIELLQNRIFYLEKEIDNIKQKFYKHSNEIAEFDIKFNNLSNNYSLSNNKSSVDNLEIDVRQKFANDIEDIINNKLDVIANEQEKSYIGKAINEYRSHNYQLAHNLLNNFFNLYAISDNGDVVMFYLGKALVKMGQYNKAAVVFLQAHKKYGNSKLAYFMLLNTVESLFLSDNESAACRLLSKIITQNPAKKKEVVNYFSEFLTNSKCYIAN